MDWPVSKIVTASDNDDKSRVSALEKKLMTIDDLGFKNERVKRLALGSVGDNQWPVSVAKSRLSEILRRARNGERQVIGIRKSVIAISVQELERIAHS